MRGSGKYLHYRNVITVDNSNSYGFTLSVYANNPDLVNSSDSNYVINSVSGHNRYLGANQWGYSMTGDSGTFNEIPNSSYNAATLADVTNDAKGVCDRVSYCGVPITFGANIEPKKSASGHYSTTLTYTATSKPAPYVPPTPTPSPPSGGGSSYDYWWSVCNDRYPYDYDERSYCYIHDGDMSGYWNEVCSKRYPGSDTDSLNRKSYCIDYKGDMSGYEPDWNRICRERYSGNDEYIFGMRPYCIAHNGDMSGYRTNWDDICRAKYPDNIDERLSCIVGH